MHPDERHTIPAPDVSHRRLTRRRAVGGGIVLAASVPVLDVATAYAQSATPATPASDPAETIIGIAEDAMAEMDLRAVLLHVAVDGEPLVTHALGESLTGMPATTDMHLRNGAVAITYMSSLLLRLVESGVFALDDPIAAWLPDLPDAGAVTLRMLANMTAGYPDYVQNPTFEQAFYADPFKTWTPAELLAVGLSTPRRFAPGQNWDYSHTNYVILGLAIEAATGRPLDTLLREMILEPLGLEHTASADTAWMPAPVLHAYSSERRAFLGIPPAAPFIEESTFWNPSWTLARGAVQYTTVADMATSFAAIGRGDLLSEASMREILSDDLLGFGAPLDGCPSCHTLDEVYLYGLGIVQSGGWMLQNPLFGGYASVVAYHPGGRIAIAVATTFNEDAFDTDGGYRFGRSGQIIFRRIGALLQPEDPPPS